MTGTAAQALTNIHVFSSLKDRVKVLNGVCVLVIAHNVI